MMKPTMALTRIATAILLFIGVLASAQFQPPLEADSPEEFDHYLTVEAASDAAKLLPSTTAFRDRWPQSKLLPRVWELRYFALQELGDAKAARAAAEEALRLAPGNLTVRAALAVQLASEDIKLAEQEAGTVIDELDRTKIRRAVPLAKYQQTADALRAQAHTALGLVRYRQGDTEAALRELESAAKLGPSAALSLRLGRLYASLGRDAEARERLTEAAKARDAATAELARAALRALR